MHVDTPLPAHRILHIMDKVSVDRSKIHGPARQIAYRVPFYPADRFKVMLCNLRQEDAACDVLRASGVEVVSLNRGKFDLRTLADLWSLVRCWKPTLLHLHGYGAHNFGRVIGRALGIPTVIQEHFVDHRLPGYQRAIDFLLKGCPQKGLAVSEAVRKHMERDRFMPASTLEVLGNGIPSKSTQRAGSAETAAVRRELGIPEQTPLIGIVGRLAEMKGHRVLLEAAKRLLPDHPDLHVLVVGDGPELPRLRAQAAALQMDRAVHFAGYQEKVVPFLSALDVSVVASLYNEGFNTVGVESFSVGVPLVITDLDCFHDLYFRDRNCLMVPPGDEAALASAIHRVLTDAPLRDHLKAGGRETVESYRMEHISGRYIAIYDALARGAAPKARS